MLKDVGVKGLILGIKVGLLITLFDSLFMFIPDTYFPANYPLMLISFNILLWGVFGILSGIALWIFFYNKSSDFKERETFYWILFFLLPFALIYGVLGRIYMPPYVRNETMVMLKGPVFDYHLSFLWVSLIITFLIFYYRRKRAAVQGATISFIPDLVICIVLFQFCSNLSQIPLGTDLYAKYLRLFQSVNAEGVTLLNIIYIGGVLAVGILYFIDFFKFRLSRRPHTVRIIIYLLCACGAVNSLFFIKDYNKKNQETAIIGSPTLSQQSKGFPVILIVLDTVRADHLSLYGYPALNKNLDAFARNAIVFENCIATSSWTLPTHASIFTGLYPTEHGAHCDLNSREWNFGIPPYRPLPKEFVTLAEIFRENGYKTGAVVSNYTLLDKSFNLNQGFQIYDCYRNCGDLYREFPFRPLIHLFSLLTNFHPNFILPYRPAEDINLKSRSFIDKAAGSPFFLFINFMDTHYPYLPPRPYASYYVSNAFPHLYKLELYTRYALHRYSKTALDAYQITQYDGALSYLDDQLGKLFDHLKKAGLYDSSLIIITSDHGEMLGEHNLYLHSCVLYEGVMKVPLLIKFPRSARAGREKQYIQLTDIFTTILAQCGLPVPDGISGKAIGETSAEAVGEFDQNYEIRHHRALYAGRYKYMKYEQKRAPELYDLERDPMEKINIAERLPNIVREMDEKLAAWVKLHVPKYTASDKKDASMSKQVLEGLKALGYIQ